MSLNLEFVPRPIWWNSRLLGDLSQRKVGRSLRDSTRGQPWGCPLTSTSMCTGTHIHAYSHVTTQTHTHMHSRMHTHTYPHPHTPKTVFKIYRVSYQFHLHPEEMGLASWSVSYQSIQCVRHINIQLFQFPFVKRYCEHDANFVRCMAEYLQIHMELHTSSFVRGNIWAEWYADGTSSSFPHRTAPALGHLIGCLHNFFLLETDLTDLILCLSNTRNVMSPSELDLSETSVNVLKMHTAWLSPKKAGSCSSVTDVCSLLEDYIHDERAGTFSEAPCNFNQATPNPLSFLSTKGVWGFLDTWLYHFCYGT